MSRMQYFWHRLVRMDWKAMWKTTGILKKRSGKGRIWLMIDMLRCAVLNSIRHSVSGSHENGF